MRVSKGAQWVSTILLLAIFVWGLDQIALAPLETGEVYPPYSSLRSDPVGSMAFYESLAEQRGIAVERLYKTRQTLDAGAAMLVLGVDPVGWSTVDDKTLEQYEKLTHDGGRLVIAFLPPRTPLDPDAKRPVEKRWAIRLASRESSADERRDLETGAVIPRDSPLYFDPGREWTTLAMRDDRASAVERAFGAGSIVLVADSYPLSNEGLREDPDAAFLSRVVGPARRILFDENHFGVVETGSVATLMRQFHLEGPVAMLAFAAALFLWRNASTFLPPRRASASAAVSGRDSVEGLSSLLRRGIPEKELLAACFAEWSKFAPRDHRASSVEAEIARTGRDGPVEAYQAACRALTERK